VLARKIVKVYLTSEQKKLLEKICTSLGMDESEVLRYMLLEYAKSIGLVTDKVHGRL
jgi:antitoxin component of RelBE/YafQ-DinJ toxin-antitoxin module